MSNKDTLRHLVAMAAADGRVSIEELRLLGDRAISLGVTDDEFESILADANKNKDELELKIPGGADERHKLLTELVRMMAADGELHDHEKNLFAVIASKMEISEEDLHKVIDQAISDGE